jgi:hypothetical protein
MNIDSPSHVIPGWLPALKAEFMPWAWLFYACEWVEGPPLNLPGMG